MSTPGTAISEMPILSQGSNDESVLLSQVAGRAFPIPECLYESSNDF